MSFNHEKALKYTWHVLKVIFKSIWKFTCNTYYLSVHFLLSPHALCKSAERVFEYLSFGLSLIRPRTRPNWLGLSRLYCICRINFKLSRWNDFRNILFTVLDNSFREIQLNQRYLRFLKQHLRITYFFHWQYRFLLNDWLLITVKLEKFYCVNIILLVIVWLVFGIIIILFKKVFIHFPDFNLLLCL